MLNKKKIICLIQKDQWMMDILHTVKSLNLNDWWICAGFVRSKIWDVLHDFSERTPIPDIDVIYFDSLTVDECEDKKFEQTLNSLKPHIPWSVKNQARMHHRNNVPPYDSSVDAISKFPETATALGVTLDEKNNVILTAPCGINDVIRLEVKPTPFFAETEDRMKIYEERLNNKKWQRTWNQLKIYYAKSSS